MAGQNPYGQQQWPGQQPPQYGQPQMGHPQQFGQPMYPGQMPMMHLQGGFPMMHPGQMHPGFQQPMPGQFHGHPGMPMPPGSMPMQYGHPGMPMPPQGMPPPGMPPGAPPPGMPMPPGMPPPPQGAPPPGSSLGLPAPPTASGAPAPPPLPQITDPLRAWVGKFPEDMDDGLLQRVLAVFGPLRNWKRGRDPDTDETKGFGFAEWASPFALLNATRVLHGLPVSVKHSFVVKIGQSLNSKLQEWNEANRKASRAKAAASAGEGGEGGVEEEEGETGATVQLPCPEDVTEPWRWVWRVTAGESEQVDELGGKVVDCMQKEASGAGAQAAGEGASKAASGRAKMEQLRTLFAERCGDAGVGAAVKRVIPSGEAGVHVPQINEGIVSAIGTFREDAEAERAKARKAKVLAARERARRAKADAEAAAARGEGGEGGGRSRSRSPPAYGGNGRSSIDRSESRDHRSQDRPGERRSRFDRDSRAGGGGGRYDAGTSRRDRVDDRFVDDGSDDEAAPGAKGGAPAAAEGTARAASSAARALEGGETIKIALGAAAAAGADTAGDGNAAAESGAPDAAAAPAVTAADLPPAPDAYSGWQGYPLDKLFAVFRASGEAGTDAVKVVVSEQLTDLLGEDEPTLQGYVLSQVSSGMPAGLSPVRAELALVLDDDAEEMLTAVLRAVHAACA